MKKLLYILLFLLLIVLGATFTIQNPQDVSVQYYLDLSWRGPLALLLLATLSLGIIVGVVVGFFRNLALRRRYVRKLKEQRSPARGKSRSELIPDTRS